MSRSARYRARYISGGTIRACSKAHYRSESVMFHWLLDFNFLGIVLDHNLHSIISSIRSYFWSIHQASINHFAIPDFQPATLGDCKLVENELVVRDRESYHTHCLMRSWHTSVWFFWISFFIHSSSLLYVSPVFFSRSAWYRELCILVFPEASNFVGRRAAKVPWIYGALFSSSEMHFWLIELPFEITLLGDLACFFFGRDILYLLLKLSELPED
ncbi:hypothetical protein F2Q68_00026014 [Brassica cretica]|uniref:Uncharacterized protein n=1 Tax=Brassica cretica TaxID=69181 RepID=A0A8S9I8C1_BRACR|nr:hypothetical protein F2Q68_00026014 [Brassica cretica]